MQDENILPQNTATTFKKQKWMQMFEFVLDFLSSAAQGQNNAYELEYIHKLTLLFDECLQARCTLTAHFLHQSPEF